MVFDSSCGFHCNCESVSPWSVEQPKLFLNVSSSNIQITTDESNEQRYLSFLAENHQWWLCFFVVKFLLFIFVGKDQVDRSACPISGEYSGILPDGPQFCAKMSSDCNNPDIMFYNVADCNNASEILEGKVKNTRKVIQLNKQQ